MVWGGRLSPLTKRLKTFFLCRVYGMLKRNTHFFTYLNTTKLHRYSLVCSVDNSNSHNIYTKNYTSVTRTVFIRDIRKKNWIDTSLYFQSKFSGALKESGGIERTGGEAPKVFKKKAARVGDVEGTMAVTAALAALLIWASVAVQASTPRKGTFLQQVFVRYRSVLYYTSSSLVLLISYKYRCHASTVISWALSIRKYF